MALDVYEFYTSTVEFNSKTLVSCQTHEDQILCRSLQKKKNNIELQFSNNL